MKKAVSKKMPNKKTNTEQLIQFLFCLGIVNLTFIFLLFALATLGFALTIPITPFHILIAFILTVLISIFISWYYYGKQKSADYKIAACLVVGFGIILILCLWMAGSFYDTSFDGQWYHQGAVIQLENGYNPIYGQVPSNYSGAEFINDYPKTMETVASEIFSFTHNIEDGKLVNPFLMVTAFLLIFPAIAFAFPKLDIKYSLVIAALCALNPVCIYQSLSFYVDGASAALLAIIVFLMILAFKKMDYVLYSTIAIAIILAINIKFFDLVYVAIIVLGFVVMCKLYNRATLLHYLLIASVVVGVLFGFNPYIMNFVNHGTPFYPIEGVSTELITNDTPQNIIGMNPSEQFVYSIFSQSSDEKTDAYLKMPLTVNNTEGQAFYMTDTRSGGFGVLFSAIFILMIILAAILVYMNFKDGKLMGGFLLLMCLIILISVLINPSSWWARYVPQLWLIPLILLVCSCQRFTGKLKLLNYALIALMVINVLSIAYWYYPYQAESTACVQSQLSYIKYSDSNYINQQYVLLDPGNFPSLEERFSEAGINYTVDYNLTAANASMVNGGYNTAWVADAE